jgi:hypothetical protein
LNRSSSAWYSMVYFSLALILIGILIFLYSIILDAKKRCVEHTPRGTMDKSAPRGAGSGSRQAAAAANERNKAAGANQARFTGSGEPAAAAGNGKGPAAQAGNEAVLFEDSSHIIDYGNESGSIDPSLEGYKNIKRIGNGKLTIEKGGITFFMGKKLYRYDFHRIRDLKPGNRHLALFLHGSGNVKLFIVDPGSGIINAVSDAYQEYLRSSA